MTSIAQYSRVLGIALLATTLVVAVAATLVLAVDVVLILVLALLFGIFLTKTSQLMARYIPLSYRWNLGLLVVILLAFAGGTIAIFGVNIESQLTNASKRLDEGADSLQQWLDQHPVARGVIKSIPFAKELVLEKVTGARDARQNRVDRGARRSARGESNDITGNDSDSENPDDEQTSSNDIASRESSDESSQNEEAQSNASSRLPSAAGRVFSVLNTVFFTTLGLVTNLLVILVVGIFLAVDPRHYRDGFVRLFPVDRRERTREILNRIGDCLFAWLLGRLMAMAITGVGTGLALWALGVPLPVTVGLVTGLLTFIPNLGALIAIGLAVLVALPQGPATVAWVVALYLLLQLLESNVITPLVQQHQTSVPPALLISFQILMGALTGFLGLTVSTPLLAAGMVLVKEAWIKDTLGDEEVDV